MKKENKYVIIWLLSGCLLLFMMVVVGGITRLTNSGLSMTDWHLVTDTFPPLTEAKWLQAFEEYKKFPEYQKINIHNDFTLSDYKFIYFWEWFHREWARLIAIVFLLPFVYFIIKKKFKQEMVKPLMILFLLGILQGLIGWIMVKSGLNEESLYVNHIRLAIHFISALGLLSYTLWFALQLLVDSKQLIQAPSLKKFSVWLFVLIVVQLIFGAFMAGLKAAQFATTWPTINGEWIPASMSNDSLSTFTHDPLAVHFIHRTLAYIIAILIFIWFQQAKKITSTPFFQRINRLPIIIVPLQVLLGILTVLFANNASALLWLGVAHQFTAMLLVLVWVTVLYVLRGSK